MGGLLSELGKRADAAVSVRQAVSILETLSVKFPTVSQYRADLAVSLNGLGTIFGEMGNGTEAEKFHRQALDVGDKLVADFPTVPRYRADLARCHNSLGVLLFRLGRRADAESAFQQALTIQARLTAEFPDAPQYREAVAASHTNLGNSLLRSGNPGRAEESYRQALKIEDQLVAEFPAAPRYREALAESHSNLGAVLHVMAKPAEAEKAFRLALTIEDKLATDFPAVPGYRVALGGSEVNLGHLLRASGKGERALDWYAKAVANLEGVLRQVKADDTAQSCLRNAHYGRARTLDDLERHVEAIADWDKAVELSPESERAALRMNRAVSRVRAGQAVAAVEEAEELAKNSSADVLYNAACVLALAAERENLDGSLLKEERAKRAMALLQQAVEKGWKDAEHMKKDDDLKALRERRDFKKLLADLEKQSR
jgi:tetratricopeptide (TPR) repeat protein